MRHASPWIPLLCLVALPAAVMLALVLLRNGGAFTYTLDDPYIHLALAKNLWHGHYGLNPEEPAAPSSSVLWPFLLAPFAAAPGMFEFAPLAINLLCFAGLVALLNRLFADLALGARLFTIACVVIALNAFGLIFSGMEHELQVLLVAVIAVSLLCAEYRYLYLAATLLPFVRYEGLAVSVPVLLYAAFHGERRRAALCLAIIVVGLAAFSLFLKSVGLDYLPTSVLAKSTHGGLRLTAMNANENLLAYGFLIPVVYWLCRRYWVPAPGLALVIAAVTALQFLFGHFGWFGRYEVWWLMFLVLFALRAVFDDFAPPRVSLPTLLSGVAMLPLVFYPLTFDTLLVPAAAANVYNQQATLAAVARAIDAPVAVNDLGLVALRSGDYVLDLWGLGSLEALRARTTSSDPQWIRDTMASKGVRFAFIYDDWFPRKPAGWVRVGVLKLLGRRVTASSDTVTFYATDAGAAAQLRRTLERYSHAIAPGYRFEIL